MARLKRIGVKRLQTMVAGWVHEVIAERTAKPGVETWMVVEDLMRAGLRAEIALQEAKTPVIAMSSKRQRPKVYTDMESAHAYLWAKSRIEVIFAKQTGVFMQTISKLQGEKKELTLADWRRWAKKKRVPEQYMPGTQALMIVVNGMRLAWNLGGVFGSDSDNDALDADS